MPTRTKCIYTIPIRTLHKDVLKLIRTALYRECNSVTYWLIALYLQAVAVGSQVEQTEHLGPRQCIL